MIAKRHLILVALLTFCVTATLFAIQPTRSQYGPGEYNPWTDYNEDGTINILDLVPAATSYGTTGDSTKNVNVTNWQANYKIDTFLAVNISWGVGIGLSISDTPEGFAGGFSKMSIQVSVYNWSHIPYSQTLYTDGVWWAIHEYNYPYSASHAYVPIPQSERMSFTFYLGNPTGYYESDMTKGTVNVIAPYYRLSFSIQNYDPNGWVLADVYVYLRNE